MAATHQCSVAKYGQGQFVVAEKITSVKLKFTQTFLYKKKDCYFLPLDSQVLSSKECPFFNPQFGLV